MAHLSGKELYVAWNGTDISADFRSLDIEESYEVVDVTAGNDAAESHVGLRSSGSASYECVADDAASGTAIRASLRAGATGTLEWGPFGTAAGKPKYSRAATITSASRPHSYNSEQTYTAEFTFNGDWIANFDSSGTTY